MKEKQYQFKAIQNNGIFFYGILQDCFNKNHFTECKRNLKYSLTNSTSQFIQNLKIFYKKAKKK